MDEYNLKVIVRIILWIMDILWIIICLCLAMACYLYFIRIPNIQTRISKEIEDDLLSTLLNNLPAILESLSLEEREYLSLDDESFHHLLEELSRNIRSRERSESD